MIRPRLTLIAACVALAPFDTTLTATNPTCHTTNLIQICHASEDEGVYYRTPSDEVAYNVQILNLGGGSYRAIYHSEPNRNCGTIGDSIKTGLIDGATGRSDDRPYFMPSSANAGDISPVFRLFGSTSDLNSIVYFGGDRNCHEFSSGGGNPTVVRGRYWAGDQYFYMFFLGAVDPLDIGSARMGSANHHYVLEARTLDFQNFDVWSAGAGGSPQWRSFTSGSVTDRRPSTILDTTGSTVWSRVGAPAGKTLGMIGSIVEVDHTYYYFYTDCSTGTNSTSCDGESHGSTTFSLYYRTNADPGNPAGSAWSTPTTLITGLPMGPIVRVARAKGLDHRWALTYDCTRGNTSTGDVCMYYTAYAGTLTPGVIGHVSAADLYDSTSVHNTGSTRYLGLTVVPMQHYLMTDQSGNLISPHNETSSAARGGMVTWTRNDGTGPYNMPVYRAGWDISCSRQAPEYPC